MSAHASTKTLTVAVLVLTLAVLALGGAVVAIRLRPEPLPVNALDRELVRWQRAVEADPSSDIAHTGLGLALLNAGETEAAERAFEEAARLNPDNWMARFQLGLLSRESAPDRALALVREAARKAPPQERAVVLIAEGDILLEIGDAAAAATAYRRSIVFNPFLFDSHFGLARALEELGKLRQALDRYREAQRFAPEHPEVVAAIERLERNA
jgi:tetratricopeptide (TPR) repeat protein